MPKRIKGVRKIIFDFKDLKLRIKKYYDTQKAFADAMNMDLTTLNQRLNNVVDWRPNEIFIACRLLEIPFNEISVYFFVEKI